LEGLDAITNINMLTIVDNPNLEICGTTSICNYLQEGGNADISQNSFGCNTETQILNSCSVVDIQTPKQISEILISPNPSTGIFQVNDIPQGTYQIHDTAGRIIQSGDMENDLSIDISQEVQGVYFLSIHHKDEVLTRRIIKL